MYPFLPLGEHGLYMTWIGTLVSLLVFLWVLLRYSYKYKLSVSLALYTFPVFLFLCYIGGLYVHYVVTTKQLFVSMLDIVPMLSPAWYNFHFVGIAWWFAAFLSLFLLRFPRSIKERKKRVDAYFMGTACALVPLGIFAILWDDIIGVMYEGVWAIRALSDQSELIKYGSVFPVGILYSGVWVCALIITRIMTQKSQVRWTWYLWFMIILGGLSLVFFFQEYPLSGVINLWWIRMDIKQYAAWMLMAYIWLRKSADTSSR